MVLSKKRFPELTSLPPPCTHMRAASVMGSPEEGGSTVSRHTENRERWMRSKKAALEGETGGKSEQSVKKIKLQKNLLMLEKNSMKNLCSLFCSK